MVGLQLHLFGGFSARMDGSKKALSFSRRKGAALLAVLATPAGRNRTREELADLLWSRTGEDGARNNLRQNLYHIRGLLPDFPGLVVTAQGLQLKPEFVRTDTAEFDAAARGDSLTALERAAELYAGEFLQGLSLSEQPFEEWRAREAARLLDIALSVFERLLAEYETSGRYADAVAMANRALAIDPLHEFAHETLVRVYAAEGRHGLSKRHAKRYRELLASEHGIGVPTRSGQLQRDPKLPGDRAAVIDASPAIVAFGDAPIVAVLPIACSQRQSASISHAMTASLIAVLAAVLPMTIIDHRTILAVSAVSTTTRTAAASLGARYAIEGSLNEFNGRWRLDVSLIDVGSGRHLWTGSSWKGGSDLFGLADGFAFDIAAGILRSIELTEQIRTSAAKNGRLDAWQTFQHGLHLLSVRSVKALPEAQAAFERVIELEPFNHRAQAGLARCVLDRGISLFGETRENAYPRALEINQRAHSFGCDDWYVNWQLGMAYHRNEKFDLAKDALLEALRLLPGNLDVQTDLGNLLSFMGETDQGIRLLTQSLRWGDRPSLLIARSQLQTRNYTAAVCWADREIQSAPNNTWAYLVRGSALGHLDRPEEGWASLMECERRHSGRVNGEFAVAPSQYSDPHQQDHILKGIEKCGWHP